MKLQEEALDQEDKRALQHILELIAEKKGERSVILDMRGFSIPTNFFIITEGDNPKQVEAIANNIIENFPKALLQKEGLEGKNWVVLDYGDLMIHIFQRQTRRFYDLEGLWGEVEIKLFGNDE